MWHVTGNRRCKAVDSLVSLVPSMSHEARADRKTAIEHPGSSTLWAVISPSNTHLITVLGTVAIKKYVGIFLRNFPHYLGFSDLRSEEDMPSGRRLSAFSDITLADLVLGTSL